MSTAQKSLTVECTYTGTDFTRTYNFTKLDTATPQSVQSKIIALNASLAGGTDGGLADFFVSDDYDGTNGKLKAIKTAKVKFVTTTPIMGIMSAFTAEDDDNAEDAANTAATEPAETGNAEH